MSECIIEVEKIFQSPTTPVHEVVYLVRITLPEQSVEFQKELLEFLEKKSNIQFKQTMPM